MKPERWQQLDKLFHSALQHEPAERAAFLDEACAGDESLRKKNFSPPLPRPGRTPVFFGGKDHRPQGLVWVVAPAKKRGVSFSKKKPTSEWRSRRDSNPRLREGFFFRLWFSTDQGVASGCGSAPNHE